MILTRTLRPVTYERLVRAEEYALDRLAGARSDRKEFWERIVDAIQDRREAMVFEDDDPDAGWLCSCGNYQDDDWHCDDCGAEPPWGCQCADCDGDGDEDEYDESVYGEDFP